MSTSKLKNKLDRLNHLNAVKQEVAAFNVVVAELQLSTNKISWASDRFIGVGYNTGVFAGAVDTKTFNCEDWIEQHFGWQKISSYYVQPRPTNNSKTLASCSELTLSPEDLATFDQALKLSKPDGLAYIFGESFSGIWIKAKDWQQVVQNSQHTHLVWWIAFLDDEKILQLDCSNHLSNEGTITLIQH
ncbi:hypothetical protein [Thalassotalea agarivorans]|uniref:Uncharacterized protein n=1 Tax=Thalassotalea agarivorans TaxID=349064 RepID=A0A1I0GNV5_THASX|nr:hypothetical protein [Thalassotalea agarivorans]SET72717.1 hypothetical protein SAMN05660429_02527 [Thalassotalea agarivorans]